MMQNVVDLAVLDRVVRGQAERNIMEKSKLGYLGKCRVMTTDNCTQVFDYGYSKLIHKLYGEDCLPKRMCDININTLGNRIGDTSA